MPLLWILMDNPNDGLPTNSTSAWITHRACGASRYPHDHKTGGGFASLKNKKDGKNRKIGVRKKGLR
jgi:hypothetical protein